MPDPGQQVRGLVVLLLQSGQGRSQQSGRIGAARQLNDVKGRARRVLDTFHEVQGITDRLTHPLDVGQAVADFAVDRRRAGEAQAASD
ncbi:hypothetical protein ACFLSJ_03930, partial [Verrucomicrobiota bacterium]